MRLKKKIQTGGAGKICAAKIAPPVGAINFNTHTDFGSLELHMISIFLLFCLR
jgi:hypothetical protein